MGFYEFTAIDIDGKEISMSEFENKLVLVVNTASKCGFTPQFADLEKLYRDYKDRGFYVLGFPCNQFASQDPGADEEIAAFCQLNYGVTFPMFSKIDVNGNNAHPIWKWLKEQKTGLLTGDIKWNFTKFLIDRKGNVVKRYGSNKKPENIRKDIEELL